MQSIRNLRLAVRLALAFGALAVGLLLVGGVAVQQMGNLKHRTTELGDVDLKATALSGSLGERAALIAHHVAQHLYVKDGDLKAEDAIQKHVLELAAANTRDGKTLAALLAGTDSADEMTRFATARATFVES